MELLCIHHFQIVKIKLLPRFFPLFFRGYFIYIWYRFLFIIHCWESYFMMTVKSAFPLTTKRTHYIKLNSIEEGCLLQLLSSALIPGFQAVADCLGFL